MLVDCWASRRGPCRPENPALRQAYAAFRNRKSDTLGVSPDDAKGRDKGLKAIADDQLPWTRVVDLRGWQHEAGRRYGVRAAAQDFLIDPAGKIVASNLPGDDLPATLARLLQ